LGKKRGDGISVRAPQGTWNNRGMVTVVNKSGVQLNEIKAKHSRAYPPAEDLMITLVEFAPSKSAENCPSAKSESGIHCPSFFVKIWIR